jgi:hypothetical protein
MTRSNLIKFCSRGSKRDGRFKAKVVGADHPSNAKLEAAKERVSQGENVNNF